MEDSLSEVLGTFGKGVVTFSYLDVVKAAGHSCPTVGGAYLMTLKALQSLYPDSRPVRGNISVVFSEVQGEGVAGVVGNVVTHITGAAGESGFKGLNGRFARHSLMAFGVAITSSARFTRTDTGKSVDVFYDPGVVPPKPEMQLLMPKVMASSASEEEIRRFGELWQERVESILLENNDNKALIRVTNVVSEL